MNSVERLKNELKRARRVIAEREGRIRTLEGCLAQKQGADAAEKEQDSARGNPPPSLISGTGFAEKAKPAVPKTLKEAGEIAVKLIRG